MNRLAYIGFLNKGDATKFLFEGGFKLEWADKKGNATYITDDKEAHMETDKDGAVNINIHLREDVVA